MNLRDRLRAIDTPKKPQTPQQIFTSCWERVTLLPYSDALPCKPVPTETLRSIQNEALPLDLQPSDILFLDTETTGLSSGAGTVAFQVGLGQMQANGFAVTQLVMRDYPEEVFLLEKVQQAAESCKVICTFNGKTFDLPLLRTRLIMNRLNPGCLDKPHIDLLPMARRLWKLRLRRCNLATLEEAILGMPREDDLPGAMVPQRYFDYLRTKQFSLLEDVLRHNQQDIASLCTLLYHMAAVYEQP